MKMTVTKIALVILATAAAISSSCVPRDYGYGSIVCVCNSTYCDMLPRPTWPLHGAAITYTSSKAGLRFQKADLTFQKRGEIKNGVSILRLDRSTKYQSVIGFGGAFTDSAGLNILSLPKAAQDLILRSYFSKDGLEYSLGRIPIGGSDFSTRPYTYDDNSKNSDLKGFALQKEDFEYKVPLMKRAQQMLPEDAPPFHILAAAWSPPPWMKTNNDFKGFSFLKAEYYQPWADYHIRFLEEYDKLGLKIWAISTGNEPLNGIVPINLINSVGWLPNSQRHWLINNFGPTLRSSAYNSTLLLALDDQRILLPWWVDKLLSGGADQYVDGIAVHWYLNFISPATFLTMTHNNYPSKFLISTEASNGDKPWQGAKVQLGSWERGEAYIQDIIEVMNHWVTGWMDWNLALDPTGGPNWIKNFVDAPIIVNATSGEFYKQPMFYAMGHVSKFVPRDSVRIKTSSSWPFPIDNIAFLRPDGAVVVILLNRENSNHNIALIDSKRGQISLDVPANSFVTLLYS